MTAKYSIYTLADPVNGHVRYVGITAKLKQRYQYHCGACDSTSSAYWWLKRLKSQGLAPLLQVVEEADSWEIAYKREAYWMVFFLEKGEPLVNYLAPIRKREALCSS